MKRLLIAGFAAAATAGGALAADVPPVIPPAPPPIVVPVHEPGNLYVSAFAGIVFAPNTVWYQPEPEMILSMRGFRLAAAVGRYFGNGMVAVEGDVTWARVRPTEVCTPIIEDQQCTTLTDEGLETNATLLTLMGNVRIGPNDGTFRPYVAFGGGAARLALDSPAGEFGADGVGPGGGDNTDWTWGFQAIVGLDIALNDTFSVGGRYRFQRIGPTSFIDLANDPFSVGAFNVHSFEGGITIHFP